MAIIRDEDWEMITLVLDGEIEEHDPAFQDWLASGENNLQIYKDLKQVRAQAAAAYKYDQYESGKQALWSRVMAETVQPPVRKISNWWKYAAAVIAPLAILTSWLAYRNMSEKPTSQPIADFHAPVPKASLRLSDGSILNLDSTKELHEKDGTHLSAGALKGLQYVQNDGPPLAPVYNTLVTAKGGAYVVTLEDGTRVWLNAVSELSYPTRFTGENREVVLKGEAYFEVAKDVQHPFIVKTELSRVQVTGTHFNVYAYPMESVVATLVEGGINFGGVQNNARLVKLSPSQQAEYARETGDIKLKTVDTDIYTSWKQGGLYFENERLDILLRKLDRWYDFNVNFSDPKLKELRFTGKADKTMSIDYILQLVSLTTQVKFNLEGRLVTVNNQ